MGTLLTPLVLSAILILFSLAALARARLRRAQPRTVVVLVLGDIGRSPRMMYHAKSFARHGFQVYLIGFGGSAPLASLRSAPNVHTIHIPTPPAFISKLPRAAFVLVAPLKVVLQTMYILWALFVAVPLAPEFLIVQNPPSIPTLALAQLAARLRGSRLILDWHNLGYSILQLRLGPKSPLVRVARVFERFFGRRAHAHLFVTRAMRDKLSRDWDLIGQKIVLHDRPPDRFRRQLPEESDALFTRLNLASSYPTLAPFIPTFSRSSSPRPALLVSSTSWTADEDFSLLLSALSAYEQRARSSAAGTLPKILVLVTGKGPLKAQYEAEVARREREDGWEWVKCRTVWLEAEDYPKLLGSADLGISLHSSSSALDLPMKVVDMFGCDLPVCALAFSCLEELVQDRKNGLVFQDAAELSQNLEDLLRDFPHGALLASLRHNLERARASGEWTGWRENWDRTLGPVVVPELVAWEGGTGRAH